MARLRVVALLLMMLAGAAARADVKVTVGDVADRRMRGQMTGGLDVELRLSGPELLDCRGYRVHVNSASDDTGAAVPQKPSASARGFLALRKATNPLGSPLPGDEYAIRLYFKNPARSAMKLKELSGEVVLFNPAKDPASVVTKRVSEVVGKPLDDDALKGAGIAITFVAAEEKVVSYAFSDPQAKIGVIDFQDKTGKRRDPARTVSGREDDRYTVKVFFAAPIDDPVAKIHIVTDAAQLRVPFHLQDVPLP